MGGSGDYAAHYKTDGSICADGYTLLCGVASTTRSANCRSSVVDVGDGNVAEFNNVKFHNGIVCCEKNSVPCCARPIASDCDASSYPQC